MLAFASVCEIAIREARSNEFDDVAALLALAYAEYAPDRGSERRSDWDEYFNDVTDVRGRVEDGSILIVAEQDGRLAGTATFYPSRCASSGGDWPAGWAAIRLVAVLPDARGRGVGSALTEHCLGRARREGAPTVGLHTSNMMTTALALYERLGFVREPEHDHNISTDLVVMRFRLDL